MALGIRPPTEWPTYWGRKLPGLDWLIGRTGTNREIFCSHAVGASTGRLSINRWHRQQYCWPISEAIDLKPSSHLTQQESSNVTLVIPELSFVVIIGVSGSGKSTFARKHFKPTEILSSDYCRGLVSDDENSQAATKDAFELLHFIARKRLAAGKLTVVDATNVQPESRKPLVEIAREFHCLPAAIMLDVPQRRAHDRNKTRADSDFG